MSTEIRVIDIDELEEAFNAPLPAIIGDGKRKATEIVEYTDGEEARYIAKMGLGKDGNPMPVHKVLALREVGNYGLTLDEGFHALDAAGDDSGSAIWSNPLADSGFNEW